MKPKPRNERTPRQGSAAPDGASDAQAAWRWNRAKVAQTSVWAILLIGWFALALYYIHCTPDLRLHHDAAEHVEYSLLIAAEHKFPAPYRSLEAHQPPLFYLLCQLWGPLPSARSDDESSPPVALRVTNRTQFEVRGVDAQSFAEHLLQRHIPRVRTMSAVFGLAFLACCVALMHRFGAAGWCGMVAFTYIATLPSVLILLTAYSNDVLVAMFGGGLALCAPLLLCCQAVSLVVAGRGRLAPPAVYSESPVWPAPASLPARSWRCCR